MIRLALLIALLAPMAHAQQPLASYVDRNRVLLLFAPNGNEPVYQQQLTLLNHHAEEFKDREVVVIPVLVDPTPPITPNTLRLIVGPRLPDGEQLPVRHRFGVAPPAFTAVLIGKDGGEKFRSTQPVTVEELNEIIDRMPMRKEEMRAKARVR